MRTAARKKDDEVIRGLELDVRGSEIVALLSDRIQWHQTRARAINTQIRKLAKIERDVEAAAAAQGRHDSAHTTLEQKQREHQDRARFLGFVRDHVAEGRRYRLNGFDLKLTEIMPERFGW